MSNKKPSDKEIIDGWARVCENYIPRDLTTLEKHQLETAELLEQQAKKTQFVLGELIPGSFRRGY